LLRPCAGGLEAAVNRYVVLYLATLFVIIPIDFLFLGITLMFGALFGLFCYATFDLTSLALLKYWSWAVAAVHITWGAIVTAVSSTAGLVVANWLAPRV